MKYYLIIASFALLSWSVSAQERLYSLEYNGKIQKLHKHSQNDNAQFVYSDTIDNTIPFFDDFSSLTIWPAKDKWADNYVYINSDFAKNSPTIGVATFDAIDESGALYPDAGPYQFEADQLTSQPIRLDSVFLPIQRAIKKSDSLYLSFYFQPQGKGSMPAKKDSLILEFHSPLEFDTIITSSDTSIVPRWHSVWSYAGGIPVDTFALENGHYFRQVLIPIQDSAKYYKHGFRFRFRNYASLANNYVPDWQSNGDQWNIDLVYLNIGRSVHDTILKDVAFADRAPSMLSKYEAMPYDQYRENYINEMKVNLDIYIANLDNNPQNISYKYTVQKDSQIPFKTYDAGSYSIDPFSSNGYLEYGPFAHPPVNFFYSPFENQEKIAFHTTHYLTTDPAMIVKGNDTIRYTQLFGNYYAYDDGSAEAGIGLNGASGSYAVRFELNKPDTLLGIQIFFNQIRSGLDDEYIDLTIWNDSFGKPGNIIKQIAQVNPAYSDSLNQFQTFWFDEPLLIDGATFPGLIFYAGWQQSSINNLNIGLDRYNDSHNYRFYNVDGNWQMSDDQHAGSLMLRPVVGKKNPVGFTEKQTAHTIFCYPNPLTSGELHIDLPREWSGIPPYLLEYTIVDPNGTLRQKGTYAETINLSRLSPGIYIISIRNVSDGMQLYSKLIIQ